jgi:hypothetical protein
MVQKVLHIYLENSDSPSDLLDELACSILPQVLEFVQYFFNWVGCVDIQTNGDLIVLMLHLNIRNCFGTGN